MHTLPPPQPCARLWSSDCDGYGCLDLDCFKLSEESPFWGSQEVTPPPFMVQSQTKTLIHATGGGNTKICLWNTHGNGWCWWLLAYFIWVLIGSVPSIYKFVQRDCGGKESWHLLNLYSNFKGTLTGFPVMILSNPSSVSKWTLHGCMDESWGVGGGVNLYPPLHKNVWLQMDQGRGKNGTVSIVTVFRLSGCLRSLSVFCWFALFSSHNFLFFWNKWTAGV